MAAAPNHLETQKTRFTHPGCLKSTLKIIQISHFQTEIKAKMKVYTIFTELHGHHKNYTFSSKSVIFKPKLKQR